MIKYFDGVVKYTINSYMIMDCELLTNVFLCDIYVFYITNIKKILIKATVKSS